MCECDYYQQWYLYIGVSPKYRAGATIFRKNNLGYDGTVTTKCCRNWKTFVAAMRLVRQSGL